MRLPTPFRFAAAAAALALLSACNGAAAGPPAGTPVAALPGTRPAIPDGPVGAGCAADVARFQELLAEDAQSGNLSQAVYGRARADVSQAANACAAGHEVQARTLLASAKRNYGYH